MKIRSVLVALSLCAIAASPAAASVHAPAAMAAVDANKILAEIDRRASVFEDQQYSATMAIYKGAELKKTLEFEMTMKGLDKQFIVFTAPGDVAGMKVLMEGADTLYVYTPEFKKVRRVAAHMQNQGFMGSTFTYEDQTRVRMAPYYDATLAGKEGSETTLTLVPKEGVTSGYARIDVVIDGTKGGVTKLRYYDGTGNHVRTQTREDWVKIEGELMPTKITMTDLKEGNSTIIQLSNVRVNQGVEDDLFSRRMLLRG
ncbi:outer membrane lipoprotein-sorting protein [Paraliomyxa miuraensis]|uniref:outer membrane lipoprotein-sorting protein n=1 Tax=Paraliomyxa miuraensis TaxID=376150 RepID=UPI00224FEB39|nr:outer membrane lipoprotein-sorting protein [Paraliomyxa miuraensis]MCX4242901.1 outer membrane lipoprotein-sorting protein [Paraliomyxa miuraensis]